MYNLNKSKLSSTEKIDLNSKYSFINEENPSFIATENGEKLPNKVTKNTITLKLIFFNEKLNYDFNKEIIDIIIKAIELEGHYQTRIDILITAENTIFQNFILDFPEYNNKDPKPHKGNFYSVNLQLNNCQLDTLIFNGQCKFSLNLNKIKSKKIELKHYIQSFEANQIKSTIISIPHVLNTTPVLNNFTVKNLYVNGKTRNIILKNGVIKNEINISESAQSSAFPNFQISFVNLKNATKTKIENIRKIKKQLETVGNNYDLLNIRACEYKIMKKEIHFWKDPTDFIQLCLNEISNNFGTSWSRGLLFTLTINFLGSLALYYSILLENNKLKYEEVKVIFFNNFSPIYKNDFLEDHHASSILAYSILFLTKVFVFYGIYQTVSAFRKHKK